MDALIALGSNLGDRLATLQGAVDALGALGVVRSVSRVCETAAMYVTDQPAFLNAVVLLETELDAAALLDQLLAIERRFGRVRDQARGPRTLDLDLLAVGQLVVGSDVLSLPHPGIAERAFVAWPLRDVAPAWPHPLLGASAADLADALPEPTWIAGGLLAPRAA